MTHESDIRRQFSALALAMLKATDADPDIRSVRTKVFHTLQRTPAPPSSSLVENLLISASALFLGIDPHPEELLDGLEPQVVTRAIDEVTDALKQVRA